MCIRDRAGAFGTVSWRNDWRSDVSTRLRGWLTERPEVVTVTLPGWRPESIGDGLAIDLTTVESRAPETDSLRGAMGLIIAGGPDFFGSSSTYTVLVIPENAPT